jgi:hypothetical protein
MIHYRFTIHNGSTKTESLGGASLNDDAEALAFGKRVIRDLMGKSTKPPNPYAGWTMDITEGERTVESIPLVEGAP